MVWVGRRSSGEVAVALPARLSLGSLEFDVSRVSRWRFRVGTARDGRRATADLLLLLVPAGEPVRVAVERTGMKPEVRVVRVRVPVRARRSPLKPFSHRSSYAIFAGGGAPVPDEPATPEGTP